MAIKNFARPGRSKVLVNNNGFHEKCTFCGSQKIHFLGKISYPEPIVFADTPIEFANTPELWGCKSCLSRFVQRAVPESYAKVFYAAKTSNRWTSTLTFVERRTDAVVRLVQRHLWRGAHVLDIGCSTGAFLSFAKERGCVTYGVESSISARNAASGMGHDCRASIDDFERDRLFDIIICFDVIEHVYPVGDFINRFSEVLKPGGLFFILTGNVRCWLSRWLGSRWWYVLYPEHINFPSLRYFKKLRQFDVMDICRTYAFRHHQAGAQRPKFGALFKNGFLKEKEYSGLSSPVPDHLVVVLKNR